MFDLMMTVLADNAANAPYESVRLGAEDLMEKRILMCLSGRSTH